METNPRRLIIIRLGLAIVLLCIILAIPLKTVPYQTIETYYETEMKREPYTVNEPYITEELHEKSEILFDDFRLTVPKGVDISFYIDKPDAQLAGSFECTLPGAFYIYSASGHILYEKIGVSQETFQISLPEGTYKARFSENVEWGREVHIYLTMKWTELEEVTKYKEATEYREVPVQVEKQRTVTKYKKVSMWEFIFD